MDRKPEVAFVPLTKGRRLVLGFDGGCSSCLDLARRVEGAVGEKLEVQNLRVPELQAWRKEALGEDAPWAPTLFEVKGGKVLRAWIGWRMGLALTRFLGLRDTWKVMQALGEMNAAPEPDANGSLVARAAGGMSRGQFLKGVGGAAVAMSVLSTTGNLASSASAASTSLRGQGLENAVRATAGRRDSGNVLGAALSKRIRTASKVIETCQNGDCVLVIGGGNGTCRVRRVNGEIRVEGDCIEARARRHRLSDGSTMLAVSYGLRATKRVAVYYGRSRTQKRIRTDASVWAVERDSLILKRWSVNGKSAALNSRQFNSERTTAAVSCSGCLNPPFETAASTCYDINWGCVADVCVACRYRIGPAGYTGYGLAACAFVVCPAAIFSSGCCNVPATVCAACPPAQ